MTSKQEGIFGKYLIRKSDGTPLSVDAKYFVIRYDINSVSAEASKLALQTYRKHINEPDNSYYNPELAEDIRANLETHGL